MGGHVLAPTAVVSGVVIPGASSGCHVQVCGTALLQQAGGLVGSAGGVVLVSSVSASLSARAAAHRGMWPGGTMVTRQHARLDSTLHDSLN